MDPLTQALVSAGPGGLIAATIFYDETARGWEAADIQRHESCHGIMYRLTGDSRWHP